jgi:hypothetical protein
MNRSDLIHQPDVWPLLAAKIPEVVDGIGEMIEAVTRRRDFKEQIEAKYRAGEVEQERDWLKWNDPHRVIIEAAEELHDMIVYQAMLLVWLDAELSDDAPSVTL